MEKRKKKIKKKKNYSAINTCWDHLSCGGEKRKEAPRKGSVRERGKGGQPCYNRNTLIGLTGATWE